MIFLFYRWDVSSLSVIPINVIIVPLAAYHFVIPLGSIYHIISVTSEKTFFCPPFFTVLVGFPGQGHFWNHHVPCDVSLSDTLWYHPRDGESEGPSADLSLGKFHHPGGFGAIFMSKPMFWERSSPFRNLIQVFFDVFRGMVGQQKGHVFPKGREGHKSFGGRGSLKQIIWNMQDGTQWG